MANFDKNVLKPTNDPIAGHHKYVSVTRDQNMVVNKFLNHAFIFNESQKRT